MLNEQNAGEVVKKVGIRAWNRKRVTGFELDPDYNLWEAKLVRGQNKLLWFGAQIGRR